MINFIQGRSGSGKTEYIIKQIISDLKNGKKVMLIVPEQTALSTESAVCYEAQKNNVSTIGLDVLNFSRLCNHAFRIYGGISYNTVTRGAKNLVLWDALFSSIPYLQHYKTEIENADRFVPSLAALFTEFKAYNVTPLSLSRAAEESRGDSEKLSSKLSDLSMIFASYVEKLSEKWEDPSDDLTKLASLLSKHNMFSGYNVYFDDFKGFTPQQYNVIRMIFAQADNCYVSLCLDDGSFVYAFDTVKETKKALTMLSRSDVNVTVLDCNVKNKGDDLSFLCENLWNYDSDALFDGKADSVSRVLCENVYDEADFVARDIVSKIRRGNRYSDFAVIARDIAEYKGIIDAALKKYGLPCRVFDRIELREKPLFKLITSAFNIKLNNWALEDIMVYLKTGLIGITDDECDKLQNYATTWNLRGSAWRNDDDWLMNPEGYKDVLTDESRNLLCELNEIKRKFSTPLIKLHEYLDGRSDVSTVCRQIYEFTLELGVPDTIALTEDDDEIRIWNCFSDALDTMSETIGNRVIGCKTFAGLFSVLVDESNVGTLPSTVDEITVGSADLLRPKSIKHGYILGLNEGKFPAEASEGLFFSDTEKAMLETYEINLSPGSDKVFGEELYHFYKSACMPSESVTFICSRMNMEGKELRPSFAFERIGALFTKCPVTDTRTISDVNRIESLSQSLDVFYSHFDDEIGEALKKIYAENDQYSALVSESKVESMSASTEKVSDELSQKLFGEDVYLTQSIIDKYVLCAFSYHCAHVLKLKEEKKAEFNPADTGILIHKVLEVFFSNLKDTVSNDSVTDECLEEQIDKILFDYLGAIFGNKEKNSFTNRSLQLFLRLRRTLKVLIRNLLKEFEESEFTPTFFELPINNSNESGTVAPLKIPLPDGTNAYIHGVADRVDTVRKGKDVYVRVVDYKTGSKTFSLSDVAIGLNLQMLVYLFSIWKDRSGSFRRSLGIEGEIIPAGVMYFKARTDNVEAELDYAPEKIFELAEGTLKRNGLLISDKEILQMMEKKLSGKFIPVTVNDNNELKTSTKCLKLSSLEEMGALLNDISNTVSKIATEMKSGNATCLPIRNSSHDGCKYCAYKSVCRNTSSYESDANSRFGADGGDE